jgi:peptide/nickel transport system substrate-binding protein
MNRHRISVFVAVLAAAAAVCQLAACSSGSSTQSANGSVVLALPMEPTSLDPCDDSTNANARVIRDNVVQALTALNPGTGAVGPLLATSWTHPEPRTWLFTIRPGVTFQDGSPLNAAAVAFGINRAMDPKLVCQTLSLFPTATSASVQSAMTVKIVTADPDPILPARMAYVDLPSPKTPKAGRTSTPIGTGPYKLTGHVIGQQITLAAYSGYWGPKPQVTKAKYVWRSEDTVRAAMAKTGEADIAMDLPAQDVTNDSQTEDFSENSTFFLRPLTTKAPLNDVRVREALAYAIDKKKITSALMTRTGTPTDQLVTKLINGFIPNYTGRQFDLAKAQSLLAQAKAAGVPTDTPIQLIAEQNLFPGSDEVAQALQQMLQTAGFKIQLRTVEAAAWSKYLRKPDSLTEPVNIMMVTHDNISGDASLSYPNYFGNSGHVSGLDNDAVQSALLKAATLSGPARAAAYQAIARTAYDDLQAIVPIAELRGLLMLSNRVHYQANGFTNLEVKLSDITFTK